MAAEPRILWGAGMEQFEDGPRIEVEQFEDGPRFLKAEVVEAGRAVGVLLQEADGGVSSVRIAIEDLAD